MRRVQRIVLTFYEIMMPSSMAVLFIYKNKISFFYLDWRWYVININTNKNINYKIIITSNKPSPTALEYFQKKLIEIENKTRQNIHNNMNTNFINTEYNSQINLK